MLCEFFKLAGVSVLICLVSCSTQTGSLSSGADIGIPANYRAASGPSRSTAVDGWVKDLSAPGLGALVDEAVTRNHDLKAAAARMRSAKARAVMEGAQRWPEVSGTSNGGTSTAPGAMGRESRDSYDLGLNLRWEIDLWGRLRNLQRAAEDEFAATESDYYAARLSLAANTAKAWFNAVEAEQQLRLANETLVSFEKNLGIVERSFDRGIDDDGRDAALDVRLARANVATARARVANTGGNRDAAARSLEVLLGRYPSESIPVSNALPALKKPVPTGLPGDLLLRRPDVLSQERRLAATGQRLVTSKKAFLPSLSLTGSGGLQTESLRRLLSAESLATSIAAGLAQPVFEGGRLRAGVEEAKANQDEALENFTQTVLVAFGEVETTLAAERYLESQEAALKVAASLTRDTAKAELLKKEILNYTEHSADGVKFKGESGDMTAEQLTAHLTKQYPFLVDGNQSSGGGANGGNGGGAAKGNLGGDKTERKNAIAAMFPDLNK